MVRRLDFDLGLHRLAAAAADGGGSGSGEMHSACSELSLSLIGSNS